MDICVEQLRADTVAAGATFAEDANEDDEPWHAPNSGYMGTLRPLEER